MSQFAACPFCKGQVDDELTRFGGACPHCFNDIPGDEAATDPGVQAKAAEAEAKRVEEKKSSTRTAGIVGLLLLLAVASTGLFYKQHTDREAEKAEILAFEEEDMFVVDVGELEAAEQDRIKTEQQADDASAKAAAKAANRGSDASGGTAAVEEYGNGSRFDAGDVPENSSGDAGLKQASVGSTGGGLSMSVGGATTDLNRKGIVLTDPSQIQEMAKNALSRYGGQLKQCYESRLKEDETIRGAWTVIFTIQKDGSTSGVSIQPRNKADTQLETCMSNKVENWSFQEISAPFGPIGKTYRFGATY
ncbi:MAG: AgmX/PglI C-terminal domain-containing protein [Proteobacteria bacterium]|nr:AgmX/PglI C-terminal domain-containing protein [Pseudomonadota bacterium]MCP4918093.1 AgmX/PglI C-terminal domain-containing protein [Pseudomonadota bacterium]